MSRSLDETVAADRDLLIEAYALLEKLIQRGDVKTATDLTRSLGDTQLRILAHAYQAVSLAETATNAMLLNEALGA